LASSFEAVFISSLTQAGSSGGGQQPQGLGTDCRPNTEVMMIQGPNNSNVTTWQQYRALNRVEREAALEDLRQLNRQWGYFGQPPVPNDQILHYYFDEPPNGGWPVVRVQVGHGAGGVMEVPFYNRSQHTRFNQICNRGLGQLPTRQ